MYSCSFITHIEFTPIVLYLVKHLTTVITLWIHTLDSNLHYTNEITTITIQQCKQR